MFVGASVGGFLPTLWGGELLSFSSIILSAVGGMMGIGVAFKLARRFF